MSVGGEVVFTTTQVKDFLSTGNVIGESSVLTQRPRNATITCETIVKVAAEQISLLTFLHKNYSKEIEMKHKLVSIYTQNNSYFFLNILL